MSLFTVDLIAHTLSLSGDLLECHVIHKQEAPLPRRAQRVRRAWYTFISFIGRQTTDQQLINNLYETGHETYRIPRNNAK